MSSSIFFVQAIESPAGGLYSCATDPHHGEFPALAGSFSGLPLGLRLRVTILLRCCELLLCWGYTLAARDLNILRLRRSRPSRR